MDLTESLILPILTEPENSQGKCKFPGTLFPVSCFLARKCATLTRNDIVHTILEDVKRMKKIADVSNLWS